MTVEELLPRLEAVRRSSHGYLARCPAHNDKSPSLSVRDGERAVLVKCWAGCTLDEVTAALGICVADLFVDGPASRGQRPILKLVKIDRVALAFRFELVALDHRFRAERIFSAASKVTQDQLNDADLDHAIDLIEQGYKDITKAEFFEGAADDLRMKTFHERDHEHKRRVA